MIILINFESGPLNSIPTLLKYIHFNPEHKENHNVKLVIKKRTVHKYSMV